MAVFHPYRSYNFKEKDPIIDELRTMIADSGASYKQINEASDVSVSCLRNWFHGVTRRPSYAAVAAVASALGYEASWSRRKGAKIIKFESRQKKRAAG
jgi:hypothetical protein